MKKNKKIIVSMIFSFMLIFLGIFTEEVQATEKQYEYLSDIKYVTNQSSVGWGSITLDKNLESQYNNGLITLIVDGQQKQFLKGISAHATSTLVYDITDYDYDFLTTYIGVDASRGTNGNGVKFAIYTSIDGENWDLKTPVSPQVMKGNSNAEFLKIDIKDANYLKLYAHNNGNATADHAVYANAKLIKDGYEESENKPIDYIKTIEQYNEIIREHEGQEITGEYELALLQKEFVKNVGYDMLQMYANLNEENKETLSWLFNDLENLRLYTSGGQPSGGYMASLKVLNDVYHAYKDDFEIKEVSQYGTVKGDLYKKMAITLSLTHSSRVGLWMQANAYNDSDAVVRYKIYKDLYDQGKFRKTDKVDITPWFEDYNVEEMRWVLGTAIDDESILWLNEYTQSKIDAAPNSAWGLLTPHSYIAYVWPNYSNDIYYAEENKEYFNELFSVNGKGLFEYIPYRDTSEGKIYKLWMNFRNKFGTGCVCGGISKSGHCIRGVNGIASAVIGQPGHAALLYYTRNSEGKGYWGIDNDVSGWNYSEKGERMPLGWGNDRTYVKGYNIPYIVLAQEALNDYDNLEKAEKILLKVSAYEDDKAKQEQIYREALTVQSINLDAWAGLAKLYLADETKTEEDYYQLEVEMMEALKCFPFPMHNLSTYIGTKFTSTEYQFKFALLQEKMLIEAKNYPNEGSEVLQPSLTRGFAAHLLGQVDTTLATFSFDGEDAGKIVLSERFNGNGIRWDYSLDGKNTWNEIAFTAEEEHKLQLTDEQISTITSENDIYVHIVGANYSDENIFKIDIKESEGLPTTLYANDLENKLIASIPTMKWQIKGDSQWKFYKDEEPDLTGNKTLVVKAGARGVYLESNETREFTFTEDVNPEERKYIPISHLSIHAFSTEAASQGRHATNAIDGNIYTNWHSAWNGSDRDKFIVIKLDEPKNLTALEYIPVGGGNGKIESAQILTSLDGENWTEVVSGTDWRYANANDVSKKSVDFEPTKAQYIKIIGKKTQAASASASFIAASMFNIYENKTVEIVGTYSFDGENSGKIVLLDEYKNLDWKYSLDSGRTWNNGDGETHQLTSNEMNQIDENNKIKIKFDGNETTYTIGIKKGETPNITPYLNDWENRLIGVTNIDNLEWKIENEENWRTYSEEEPVVEGNRTLLVRAKATGIYTASEPIEYQFTEDNNTNTEKYIPISHLSIHEYSTQSIDSGRPFYAINTIDGNPNTIWHTDFRYSIAGSRAFVTIKLDELKSISALEFTQKLYRVDDPSYIKNAIVYVSENGTDWIEAGRLENCERNEEFKKIKFNESLYGQYVKLEIEGYGIFASASMVNLYEDTTAKKVADFSFDGENSRKIILLDKYKGSNWVYSLDSGVTWKQSSGDEHTLTETELEELNSNDKIKIRFENNSEEYAINIQKSSVPAITPYVNDLENRLIGIGNTENLEWKIVENTIERSIDNSWTDYSEKEPIVEGNKKLLVRTKARNVFTASEALEYQFTEDNQDDTRKYVPVSRLSIAGVSAEDKAQNGAALNAIDGNYNTRWLNSAAGTDTEKYIVIKFDSAIYLSAMDYVPHSENGKILSGTIEGSIDGENYTEIAQISGWANNQNTKTIDFDKAVKVRYVKITGTETSYTSAKRHIGARMFNFYEDTTKRDGVVPTAEIEYDIETLTNHDVVATLVNPSTEITVLNNDGNTTYTFTENGSFTFEFEDSEGNEGKATATVDWICKTLPNATFTYDITNPTNKDVTVTVTFDRPGTVVTNNNGSNTYTFTENGDFTFEFRGPYGNEGSATASVDWICKTLPNATFDYDIKETTNKPVTVTVTFDRPGTVVTNNNGSNTYTFTENGEFTFEFVGPYGNSGVATARVDWIDNTTPTADITYDITRKTNQNVVATLDIGNKNLTITNNNGSNTYVFEENGSFTFEFEDRLGNKGTAVATVDWIDKNVPNASISYNITSATNQEVIATVTFDEPNVIITNNDGKNTYTFTDNDEFTFNFVDEAGNAGSTIAKVTWIDKTLPVATITYSTTNPTNQEVVATIDFDKENVIVEGGNTHIFTENGIYEFEFVGPAGNAGSAIAEVTWIDKDVPVATVIYSIINPTNQDVTATLVFENEKEGEVTIINNGGKNQYTFTENGEFIFEFADRAGNIGTANAIVNCIDKIAPTATVSYDITEKTNGKVVAILSDRSEDITITNNDGSDRYTFIENGEFTFEFVDRAGNTGTATAKVTWIDKVLPVATINYSTTEPTTDTVIATITFDKENVIVEGGNTHTFTENGEFTFEYVDEAGNMGMATAVVTWIEKEPDIPVVPTTPSFDLSLESSKETLNPGDEFEVNVKVNNLKNFKKGLIALAGKFEYDKEKLEMLEISGQNNWNLDNDSFNDNNFKFVTESDDYMLEEGIIFKVVLKVKETVEIPTEVTFKLVSVEGTNAEIDIPTKDSELVLKIEEKQEDAKISSEIYLIENTYISRVPQKTTVSEFKQNIEVNREITIVDSNENILQDNDTIATGMTVKVGEELEYTVIVIGDTNRDGEITITDIAKIKLHLIEKETLTGIEFIAGDINGDGEITVTDLAQIKLIFLGLPIE